MKRPEKINFDEWNRLFGFFFAAGEISFPDFGGSPQYHVEDGDIRLLNLFYDNSMASMKMWNFILSENERLHKAAKKGKVLIGAMKDLGCIPLMVFAMDNAVAFYPDGTFWTPCSMEMSDGLLRIADDAGIDESFCPVRAMIGAFQNREHFPIPQHLLCSVGATCDDFSAIAQRIENMGFPILWWEIPHRRAPLCGEEELALPGGTRAPLSQIKFLMRELQRVREAIETWCGESLSDDKLAKSIRRANSLRRMLLELRTLVFTAHPCPLPALEELLAELLAIHFCSDPDLCLPILSELLQEVRRRVSSGEGVLPGDPIRVFWVNPVADWRVLNLLEEAGGRICGTDYLFVHALDPLPEDCPPLEALARSALADPMVGSARQRADRIVRDMRKFGSEALVISRIPGASHCADEGDVIMDAVRSALDVLTLEIEVPPLSHSLEASLATRLEALMETALNRRAKTQNSE